MSEKVLVDNVTTIFGPSPKKQALPLVQEGVSKDEILRRTGHVVALADVSFSVPEGEVFVIMGLSGSGKSTLVRCINRLIEPTTGKISIDGQDVLSADKDKLRLIRRTKMAMVFQHFALFSHKTVLYNAAFGLKAKGVNKKERQERARNTLRIVGLEEWGDRYPGSLSGGMQQRVGLARALTTDPDILLMDEPFSALDPMIRRQMQDDLLKLQESIQKTVVFVTHDLDEAVKMGNRIAIMRDGRLIQVGTPEDIVIHPVDGYVEEFVQDVNRGRVVSVGTVMRTDQEFVLGQDTVEIARQRLKGKKGNALYVVNDEGKPVGLVTLDILDQAKGNGTDSLAEILQTDFPKVNANASLREAYSMFSGMLPLAVVDDEGNLVGQASPLDIIVGLQ